MINVISLLYSIHPIEIHFTKPGDWYVSLYFFSLPLHFFPYMVQGWTGPPSPTKLKDKTFMKPDFAFTIQNPLSRFTWASVSTDLQVPLVKMSVLKGSGFRDATACCVILGRSYPSLGPGSFTRKDERFLFLTVGRCLPERALLNYSPKLADLDLV